MEKSKPNVHIGEDIFYNPSLKFLVCKLHGNGIHPIDNAVKRHLRGPGHRSKGQALTRVLDALVGLPLASLAELRDVPPAAFSNGESLAAPIRYLKVFDGWRCVACEGLLTTSLEIVQRHAATVHGRRRGEAALWEDCRLQSLFSETKDRRYFRVAGRQHTGYRASEIVEQQSSEEHESCDSSFMPVLTTSDFYQSGSDSSRTSASNPGDWEVGSHVSRSLPSLVSRRSNLQQSIVLKHPFMDVAAKYVPLAESRLNYLLKSAAFRSASIPIFDSSPTNAAINMQTVFPESEESAVWANSLLYSTVQIMNRGVPTVEGQLLQQKTIQFMNKKLSFPDETLCSAAVGAIMVLKATAYKTQDVVAHEMHTQGLAKVLDHVARTGSRLTPAARKALFWLDLNAAAYVESARQMSHLDLPPVIWRREIRPEIANRLPVGFARHRDAFPYGLPECITDLGEFQGHLREGREAHTLWSDQYAQLELMQASIESRLELQTRACRQVGILAEAVRVALYICTYCSWMDTWNDSFLPCRLAIKVFDLIESISSLDSFDLEIVEQGRVELVLWLIFISLSAVELDDGQVEGIKAHRDRMLYNVSQGLPFLVLNHQIDLKSALEGALNDFIYVDGWLEGRSSITAWYQLELDINGKVF